MHMHCLVRSCGFKRPPCTAPLSEAAVSSETGKHSEAMHDSISMLESRFGPQMWAFCCFCCMLTLDL